MTEVSLMKIAFVVLAAGRGERLGGLPKQFRSLAGRPLWRWSFDLARSLAFRGMIGDIVLVLPDGQTARGLAPLLPENAKAVCGGKTRSLSVLSALRASSADVIMLHDAARPFASEALCERLLAASRGENAVVPLLPEANALKRVEGSVISAMDRDGVCITQTPQVFPRTELLELLERSHDFLYKDEAELWLANGKRLDWVRGEGKNFKVTDRDDWQMALDLASGHGEVRCGLGYDVHPLVPNRAFVLGGVEIPARLGPDGHSDADALTHAVCDAILSAAGLPDIGTLYPASDDRYRGVKSTTLLSDAVARVSQKGWRTEWVSAVVTCQVPRLGPWKDAVVRSLETVLGSGRVGVTFKSGEKIPPVGTADAVMVWASATIKREVAF